MDIFQLLKNFFRAHIGGSGEHQDRLVNYYLGQQSSKTLQLVIENLGASVIYDIGAHRGDWSKELLLHNPAGLEIFLFEANPSLKPLLDAIGQKAFTAVLSDSVKVVPFYFSARTGDSMFRENTERYEKTVARQVLTETLDLLISRERLPEPEIIKIDTQGSEVEILKGCRNSLNQCMAILIEMPLAPYNQGSPSTAQYFEYLNLLDFTPFELSEIHRSHGAVIQIDILFVKRSVVERLTKSTKNHPKFLTRGFD